MIDEKNIILELINGLSDVSTLLYQQKYQQALSDYTIVLDKMMDFFSKNNNETINNKDVFYNSLSNALEAIQQKDYVLLADVLEYELKEQLKELL